MKTVKFLAAAAIAATTLPALAQTQSTPRIDQRQANQAQRIEQGKKSGALTDKEATRLEKGQARVQKTEDKASSQRKTATQRESRLGRCSLSFIHPLNCSGSWALLMHNFLNSFFLVKIITNSKSIIHD